MSGRLEFSFGRTPSEAGRQTAAPFRIAVLGNFSGGRRKGVRRVGVDELDAAVAAFAPTVAVPLGEAATATSLTFTELDDFHPDALFRQADVFCALRDLRARLQRPETFTQAAAQLAPLPPAPVPERPPATGETGGELLTGLLGTPAPRPETAPGEPRETPAAALIRAAVAPYVVPDPDPRLEPCLAQVEAAMAGTMRAILNSPGFRELEAAWRSIEMLITRVEAEEEVPVWIVDATRDDLAEAATQPGGGGLGLALREHAGDVPGQTPWALLIGLDTFDAAEPDMAVLEQIARLAAGMGAPFIAGAGPSFAGCESFGNTTYPENIGPLAPEAEAAWKQLRARPEANSLGLTLPRFLLRLPYGPATDPVDSFAFDELPDPANHSRYLWGNGAVLVAAALADAFQAAGWGLAADGTAEVGELPLASCCLDGETTVVPCAETWLTDRAAGTLAGRGLIPLQSVRGRDAVRLHIRAVAAASPALRGRWR